MKSNEIRQKFLDFFADKQHQIVKSSPLVPSNDPTLLFTNAGMVQFKEVFLGQEKRSYNRATTVQRCVRAGGKHNDLENVGYTARHHTFFEMMGNFSFGDYFKTKAIAFAWDFLTKELGLPEEKLWITVHKDDHESKDIWLKTMGVSPERISLCGDKDNFWSMGDTGPCGPCSEIFYDHGADVAGGPPGSPNENGDRYIEIWNLVFMQFNRSVDGQMNKLPKPSVDTGMGLERLAAILQGVRSNYEIDLFQNLMKAVAKIMDLDEHELTSIRVIADHIRSCAFMIVDGVIPGKEGRGYVLRRIIRRAIRHGNKLGCKDMFFYKIVKVLVDEMGAAYPELTAAQPTIEQTLKQEENRFAETLEQGMKILKVYLSNVKDGTISGEMLFKLYDTYGFPLDLTADIAREHGLSIDEAGYEKAMRAQQDLARTANSFKAQETLKMNMSTNFVGYDKLQFTAQVLKILVDRAEVKQISTGADALIVLNQTPFYAESGGQIGDNGVLTTHNGKFHVTDVQKSGDAIVHIGQMTSGALKVGDTIKASVTAERRAKITTNHSATHLLHAALRNILGGHIQQKGSLVSDNDLRFDFSHNAPVDSETIQQIENLINEQIKHKIAVTTEIMATDEAKNRGAIALFGEKYANDVRVLSMGDFSLELCGGTHVANTSEIRLFKIIAETGVASGVRRIEAVSGDAAILLLQKSHHTLYKLAGMLKTKPLHVIEKTQNLIEQNKALTKTTENLEKEAIQSKSSHLASKAENCGAHQVLVASLTSMGTKSLRQTLDSLKSRLPSSVILLATVKNNKISLVCGVSKSLINHIKAGEIMHQITKDISGKGGGRPDMAQGGGSDVTQLEPSLVKMRRWIIDFLEKNNL